MARKRSRGHPNFAASKGKPSPIVHRVRTFRFSVAQTMFLRVKNTKTVILLKFKAQIFGTYKVTLRSFMAQLERCNRDRPDQISFYFQQSRTNKYQCRRNFRKTDANDTRTRSGKGSRTVDCVREFSVGSCDLQRGKFVLSRIPYQKYRKQQFFTFTFASCYGAVLLSLALDHVF